MASNVSGHASTADVIASVTRFEGGKGWVTRSAIIGIIGLVLSFVGIAVDPNPAYFSYLVAFTYWAGIALASLVLVMLFHTFRAKWPTVVRRPVETMATSLVVFLPLFIPVILGMPHLYAKWVNPGPDVGREALAVLHHKAAYLNKSAWLVRSILYFIIAAFTALRLFNLSTKQDKTGELQLTQRARSFGAGMLPLIGLVFTFAGFDWLMSLEPLWFSTIFGVYYFAGSFLATMALLIIVTAWARGRKDLYGELVTPDHLHNLGKLMFAFVAFWGYIAVSQLLLIWIANLPEETPWYLVRFAPGWKPVGIFLIIGHFFIPFGILLSRDTKRNPKRLVPVAFYVLFVHFVDVYWLVMPTLWPEGARFHWTIVTSFFGVGFTAIAFAIWKIRGHYTVAVKDPFLPVALSYRQP